MASPTLPTPDLLQELSTTVSRMSQLSDSFENELHNSRNLIQDVQRLALRNSSIASELAGVRNASNAACQALETMISGQRLLREMVLPDVASSSEHFSQTAEEPDRSPARRTGPEYLEHIRTQELRALRDKSEELERLRERLRDAEQCIQQRRRLGGGLPGYLIAEHDNLQTEIDRLESEIETHEQNIGSTEDMLDGQEDVFGSESSSLANPDNDERVRVWLGDTRLTRTSSQWRMVFRDNARQNKAS